MHEVQVFPLKDLATRRTYKESSHLHHLKITPQEAVHEATAITEALKSSSKKKVLFVEIMPEVSPEEVVALVQEVALQTVDDLKVCLQLSSLQLIALWAVDVNILTVFSEVLVNLDDFTGEVLRLLAAGASGDNLVLFVDASFLEAPLTTALTSMITFGIERFFIVSLSDERYEEFMENAKYLYKMPGGGESISVWRTFALQVKTDGYSNHERFLPSKVFTKITS